jgi:putative membrane protein
MEGDFPMMRSALLWLFASVALMGLGACKSETTPPAQPPETTAGMTYTVGDTFATLAAIHSAEIEHGMLAQKMAVNPRVKDFAEKVVNDHRVRMQKDAQLMSGLGVTPRPNPVSQDIKATSDRQTKKLSALSGADFDRAYLDEQIAYYRTALDTFDKDLLPNARDPQIRADIMDARAKANEHLKEAQDLRLSLTNQ